MLALYELIKLLPKTKLPPLSGRSAELFDLLRKERLSEDEAARRLLKTDGSKKYFNKIKNKLKAALINHLLVNPNIWVDTKTRALYDSCYKSMAIYKVLLSSGSTKAAIEMAKGLLRKVRQLELFEFTYSISSDLEYHYSAIELSVPMARRYQKMTDQYIQLLNAERLIHRHHNQVTQLYNTKNSFSPSTLLAFEEAAQQTLPLTQLGSAKLNRFIYNIIIIRYYAEYNYEKIVHFCDQAINSFPEDHPNAAALHFAFLHKKLPALIALGKLTAAKKIAKSAGKLVNSGTFNWHLILIQRVEVCFHQREFQEAYELYKAHAKYGCQFRILSEYWLIIRAYLYFFIQVGHIQPYAEERFNLGKFLNEIPLYSRDKAGVNINILIVQILVQMQREQFGRIIDRIEALGAYARKHTRYPETARAYLFIQMIIKMEAASFHRAATERKTKKLLDKLQNTPLRIGQNIAVEMVPFDFLWQEILALLANKFRGIKLNKHPTKREL